MRRWILTCALALLLCAVLAGAAFADGYVSINGSAAGSIEGMYVLGGGGLGRVPDGEVSVMTADGLVTLSPGEGLPAAGGSVEHLDVTDELRLDYDKIRVALYYYDGESSIRNGTLEYANLENERGRGYDFGYFDSDREFHALAGTGETEITMVPDLTVETPGGSVGAWHVLLPGEYRSWSAAREAAEEYGGFPAWYDGTYYALAGSYASEREAERAAARYGGEAYTASRYAVAVTRTEDAEILFEFDGRGELELGVMPREDDDEPLTWFKGYTYCGGFEYSRRSGGELTVVNVVGIEDYVRGVLPYEMSADWPLEALKAQALCARTYAAAHFDYLPGYGADVTNDTFSQVYRGTNASGSATDRAVEETEGLYITYDGEPIEAMYCSSNGGATEDSENVMHSAVPWLRGHADPYDAASGGVNPNAEWTRSFTASETAGALRDDGYDIGRVSAVETELSDSGNVIAVEFVDSGFGVVRLEGSECYNFLTGSLGLGSIHFSVSERDGVFTFDGGGWGHSLGMSQYGAYIMADEYGLEYDQIINFYYAGVELARGV